jgi:RHS repeat-associated protein
MLYCVIHTPSLVPHIHLIMRGATGAAKPLKTGGRELQVNKLYGLMRDFSSVLFPTPSVSKLLLALAGILFLQGVFSSAAMADWTIGGSPPLVRGSPQATCTAAKNNLTPPAYIHWDNATITSNPPGGLYSADYNCTITGHADPGFTQPSPVGYTVAPYCYSPEVQNSPPYSQASGCMPPNFDPDPQLQGNDCPACAAAQLAAQAQLERQRFLDWAPVVNPQQFGGSSPTSGADIAGDPMDIASGNVYHTEVDYESAGPNKLTFARFYNSMEQPSTTVATSFGAGGWRHTYDRFLNLSNPGLFIAERADGKKFNFHQGCGGACYSADAGVDYRLSAPVVSGGVATYTLVTPADTVEIYTAPTSGTGSTVGLLQSITYRNGYKLTLDRPVANTIKVTDSYGRLLKLNFSSGALTSINTPDSTTISYTYTNGTFLYATSSATVGRLSAVTYADAPSNPVTYTYVTVSIDGSCADPAGGGPYACELATQLASVTDQNGNVRNQWTYDQYSRGLSSKDYNGTGVTTIAYEDSANTRTVTQPTGVVETYSFTNVGGIPRISGVSRAATATTAAATKSMTYDSNAYLASVTDLNGNKTTYTNNSRGLPTQMNEGIVGAGSPLRTTNISYTTATASAPYPTSYTYHEPLAVSKGIVGGGSALLTINYTYDTSGSTLTKRQHDGSAAALPDRVWTYTYNTTGEMLTAQDPMLHTTTLAYTNGSVATVVDALSHTTTFSSFTGGGRPQTISDINSVAHTISYDSRQHVTGTSITVGGVVRNTTYTWRLNDEMSKVTYPDSTSLTHDFGYEVAGATLATGDTDAAGNKATTVFNTANEATTVKAADSSGTVAIQRNRTYDALGRMLTESNSGNTKTWAYAYDNNGNLLTVNDPLSNVTTYTTDALNRQATIRPQASNLTTNDYNALNQLTSVQDGQGDTWTYTYDGFGDLMSSQGPKYMQVATLYSYDKNSNLTQKTDARAIVANYTYDALNRLLTITYPASSTENVTNSYDQTGHGFGIGRLTSVTDAAGTLSRSYEEHGNITIDSRVVTGVTLATNYQYDSVGNLSKITYHSGMAQSYGFDTAGRLGTIGLVSGSITKSGRILHQPFGQITSITDYTTSSQVEGFTYDTDGEMLTATSNNGGTYYLNRSYTYDNAGNVTKSDDLVNSANENEFFYDGNNRMLEFHFAHTGGRRYQFDNIGNSYSDMLLLPGITQGLVNQFFDVPGSGVSEVDTYDPATGTETSPAYTVTSDADNRLTGISPAYPGTLGTTFVYNNAGRLTQIKNAAGTVLGSYLYDEFGQRIVKTVSGSNTLFVHGQSGEVLEETNGSGTAQQDYIYAEGRLIDLWASSTVYSVHSDRMLAPQSVTDSAGNIKWSADWNAYGDIRNLTVSGVTLNIRYPGQYYDAESGLIQNGQRDYMPLWNRYLEEDPLGRAADENLHAYVSNRPTSAIDPSGMISGKDVARTGQAICIAVGLCQQIHNDAMPPAGETTVSSATAETGQYGSASAFEEYGATCEATSGLEGIAGSATVGGAASTGIIWRILGIAAIPVTIIFDPGDAN